MADTASAALSGGSLADAIIQQEFLLTLADRSSIMGHPVVEGGNLGFAVGSNVITRNAWPLGAHAAASTAELTDVASATDMSPTPLSVTVARYSLQRNVSDLYRALDPSGVVRDPVALAQDAAGSYTQTMMGLFATAAQSASLSQSATGVDLTLSQVEDAAAQVAGSVDIDGLVCVLHGQQMRDLRSDLQSKGIMLTTMPGAGDLLTQRGAGYQGSYGGIDYYVSSHVPTANASADRSGFIFTRTGLLFGHAAVPATIGGGDILLGDGKVQIRYGDGASDFSTKVFYNMIVGAGINSAAICKIVSDA